MARESKGPLDALPKGIGSPATRALEAHGITSLTALTRISEAELRAMHGVGPKALRVLGAALSEHGLAFKR